MTVAERTSGARAIIPLRPPEEPAPFDCAQGDKGGAQGDKGGAQGDKGLAQGDKGGAQGDAESLVEYGLRRYLVVGGVMLAALLQTVDLTIVNVALPTIQGNLGATVDEGTWVLTA